MSMMADIRKILADGDCTTDEMQEDIPISTKRLNDLLKAMIRRGYIKQAGRIKKPMLTIRHMVLYQLTPRGKYLLDHPPNSIHNKTGRKKRVSNDKINSQ